MRKVEIIAFYHGVKISRNVCTQQQGFFVIGQLGREGAINISFDFTAMDKLPKGAIVQ